MAYEAWLQTQPRSGVEIGPNISVPAASTGVTGRLVDIGFILSSQTITFMFEASFDSGQTFQPYGQATFVGGLQPLDKQNHPVPREFGIGFSPNAKPNIMRVRLEVPGLITCGVNVQFDGV